MQIEDLKPGDVLLFSGIPTDFESMAIMYLTDSPVSHAAIAYRTSDKIIEETPPQVSINDAAVRFKDRAIYVRRHKNLTDLGPVLDAADHHFKNGDPFGQANLYIIGFLLVFKKVPNHRSPAMQALVMSLLKRLSRRLMDYLDRKKNPGKHAMFCSQFAFQCFKDAGAPYELTVENGILLRGPALFAGELEGPKSLVDLAVDHLANANNLSAVMAESSALFEEDDNPISDEELVKEILRALQDEGQTASQVLDHSLVATLRRFAEAAAATAGVQAATPEEALAWLQSQQACFVTPVDLLKNCPDLEKVGVIDGF